MKLWRAIQCFVGGVCIATGPVLMVKIAFFGGFNSTDFFLLDIAMFCCVIVGGWMVLSALDRVHDT